MPEPSASARGSRRGGSHIRRDRVETRIEQDPIGYVLEHIFLKYAARDEDAVCSIRGSLANDQDELALMIALAWEIKRDRKDRLWDRGDEGQRLLASVKNLEKVAWMTRRLMDDAMIGDIK